MTSPEGLYDATPRGLYDVPRRSYVATWRGSCHPEMVIFMTSPGVGHMTSLGKGRDSVRNESCDVICSAYDVTSVMGREVVSSWCMALCVSPFRCGA